MFRFFRCGYYVLHNRIGFHRNYNQYVFYGCVFTSFLLICWMLIDTALNLIWPFKRIYQISGSVRSYHLFRDVAYWSNVLNAMDRIQIVCSQACVEICTRHWHTSRFNLTIMWCETRNNRPVVQFPYMTTYTTVVRCPRVDHTRVIWGQTTLISQANSRNGIRDLVPPWAFRNAPHHPPQQAERYSRLPTNLTYLEERIMSGQGKYPKIGLYV